MDVSIETSEGIFQGKSVASIIRREYGRTAEQRGDFIVKTAPRSNNLIIISSIHWIEDEMGLTYP